MDVEPDYYEILEVHPKASPEVITRAYRLLAARYHPDAHPPETRAQAEERMKLLNQAYHVLSDPGRRAEYDRRRKDGSATQAEIAYRPPPEAAPKTPPRPAVSPIPYCAYHPGMPFAAFCHECGKPICGACVSLSHGQPFCAQCMPRFRWHGIVAKARTACASVQKISWPLFAASVVGIFATTIAGGALLFPAVLALWPTSPMGVCSVSLLAAFALATALILRLVYALERSRQTWTGAALLSVFSLVVGILGVRWVLADHASHGVVALESGQYAKAFRELSAAAALRWALDNCNVRRSYALAALYLADAECRRGSSRQLPLSGIAVRLAEDILAADGSPQPTPPGLPASTQSRSLEAAATKIYTETDMLLAEAFSRALFQRNVWGHKARKQWERAMHLLKVPLPYRQADQSQGGISAEEFLKQLPRLSDPPALSDVAAWYVAAVCWAEFAACGSPRNAVEVVSKLPGTAARAWESFVDGQSHPPATQPEEAPKQAAEEAIAKILPYIPPDRWQRCSPIVQQAVQRRRDLQGTAK